MKTEVSVPREEYSQENAQPWYEPGIGVYCQWFQVVGRLHARHIDESHLMKRLHWVQINGLQMRAGDMK